MKKGAFNLVVFIIVVIFFVATIYWFFNKYFVPVMVGPYTKEIVNKTNTYFVEETYGLMNETNLSDVSLIQYCEKDLITGEDICRYEVVDLTPMELPKETMVGHFAFALIDFVPVILLSIIVLYLFGRKI